MTPAEIIATLGLSPHPEGGHYARTWRGPPDPDGRPIGSAIHYLLGRGERSHWHRVDAAECWLFHRGGPLELRIAAEHADVGSHTDVAEHGGVSVHTLGVDLAAGEEPQVVVPARAWQSAAPTGDWTLVSCVVVPGFSFDGFELAAADWTPEGDRR